MDQKTLLAVILSVAVLFGYEAIFVAPKRAQAIKMSQSIAINSDTAKSKPILSSSSENTEKPTLPQIMAELWSNKTTSVHTDISSVGGTIHNLRILNNHPMPISSILSIKGYEDAEFKLISNSNDIMVLSYQDKDRRIVKSYDFGKEHLISAKIEVTNLQTMSRLDNIQFNLLTLDFDKIDSSNKRETMLDEYSTSINGKIVRKGNAVKFTSKEDRFQAGQVDWVGFRDHYTALIVHPEFKTKDVEVKSFTEKTLGISMNSMEETVAGGGTATYQFTIYAGPQDASSMKKFGKGFEKIVAFFNFAPLNMLAMAIYYTVPFLQSIFKSWGLCIILISLIIYGLTYPLTIKSMVSMRKMQQTQPKIKALQERYKSDPQKLNAEIMEIYKREKINPLGGCLPMLLQMPIFIALYQALWRASYFQGKGFLWIKDLSLPDRLFIMPFSLPFLGNEFNILPILMAIVMFAQQKISAKNMVVTDEQAAMQQKMMMYFFPVFIGFIFYKFASGLSLYFTVFYLLSTLTQWKMSKVR